MCQDFIWTCECALAPSCANLRTHTHTLILSLPLTSTRSLLVSGVRNVLGHISAMSNIELVMHSLHASKTSVQRWMRSKRKSINHSRVSMYMASIAALGSVVVGSVVQDILAPFVLNTVNALICCLATTCIHIVCIYIYVCMMNLIRHMYALCHTYTWVAPKICVQHTCYTTCVNESCHTRTWDRCHIGELCDSFVTNTYAWVMSLTWMKQVSHRGTMWIFHEKRVRMSPVTHVHETGVT